MNRSPAPSRWIWPLLSIHLAFLAIELLSLTLRGHFLVLTRSDLARTAAIGALGYGVLFLLEAAAMALLRARVWVQSPVRAAGQLALTVLLAMLVCDHIGRHRIDSPFALRSLLLFGAGVAVSLATAWLLALLPARSLSVKARAGLGGPIPPLLLMFIIVLSLALLPLRRNTESRGSETRPNVILISIDTARADYLSSYGFPAPTTPTLDRIAEAGALFENAYAQENWTLPSHASILTALYPPTHGVEDLDSRLAGTFPTVAEVFAEHGYRTLGIVDGDRRGFVGESRGFDRGFDHYLHYPEGRGVDQAFLPFRLSADVRLFFEAGHADEIVTSACRWIGGESRPPFFLFLHFYDVHASWGSRWPLHRLPYQNHSERPGDLGVPRDLPSDYFVRGGLSGARYLRAVNRALDSGLPVESVITTAEVELLRGLYASNLRFVDRQIGELDRFLEAHGLTESTIVLITSDHGEEFFEHGRLGHHQDHRETLHVPLLLRWPARIPPATRHRGIVETVDFGPTLLDLCGLPVPRSFQGRSLVPSLRGEAVPDRPAFMGNQLDDIFGVRTRTFSFYVHGLRQPGGPREEIYDVRVDPAEQRNLREREPAALDTARTLLVRWLQETLTARAPGAGPAVPLDPQTRELLRSLGYTN